MFKSYRGPGVEHSDHEHEEMANTLMEAQAIQNDKNAMKHVSKKLKNRSKAIDSIQKLRDLSKVTSKEYNDGNDPGTKTTAKKIRESSDQQGYP